MRVIQDTNKLFFFPGEASMEQKKWKKKTKIEK